MGSQPLAVMLRPGEYGESFGDVFLDRRVATLKPVLVPQPFKNALGGVALFAGTVEAVLQPLIDEAGEPEQIGPFDQRRSLIPAWDRKHHLLLQARTRHPEMARCRSFAHTAPTREANFRYKSTTKIFRPPGKQQGPKWQHFTLPAARLSRHLHGSLLHCRSWRGRSRPRSFSMRMSASSPRAARCQTVADRRRFEPGNGALETESRRPLALPGSQTPSRSGSD